MKTHLACPTCGCTTFYQHRIISYGEHCVVSFSLIGEIEEELIEDRECNGEESSGAYYCKSCGWKLIDENGEPITEPDEIVAKIGNGT